MAHLPFPKAHIGDRYQPLAQSFNSSTAYTGAIDISNLDDETLNETSYSLSPSKTPKSTLSTRLLSSIPAAQPAASAAFTRSKSILHSRAKSLASWTSNLSTPSTSGSNKLFGDLFAPGESVVRLGVAAASPIREEEDDEMDYRPVLTQRPSYSSRRSIVTAPSKQGWFGRKSIGSATPASNDELVNLNINNALFPNGPADSFSPSDFNDLLLNATQLLERMQTAYKEKVDFIASMQPEMEAQREEVEEAETRAQHLKMQLEEMSRKTHEHEQAMSALRTQLEQERSRSIRVVDDSARRRKRGSAGSASDSGFESDWDRDTESVASSNIHIPRTPPPTTGSPFDNLDQRLHDRSLQRQATLRASNVRADDSTVAWNTVQQLRTENQDLRRQVEVMQSTLQGCIDLVDTVQL